MFLHTISLTVMDSLKRRHCKEKDGGGSPGGVRGGRGGVRGGGRVGLSDFFVTCWWRPSSLPCRIRTWSATNDCWSWRGWLWSFGW